MGTVSKSTVATPLTTTTGTLQRDVSDVIRRLNPKLSPICSLVKSGDVDKDGFPSYSKGMISKLGTEQMKFEWFTSTPLDIAFTATGGTSGATGTVTMADNSIFAARDTVVNTKDGSYGMVTGLTSTDTINVTGIGGNWSVSNGDVVVRLATVYEEGSSNPFSRTKEPDNNYNFVFPFRTSWTIAETALNSKHYGEPLPKRYATDAMYDTLRGMENSMIMAQRASSNNTTSVTIDGTAYSMYSTRGLWNFAAVEFDVSGAMSWEKWNKNFANTLPTTLDPDSVLYLLCGKTKYNDLQYLANKQLIQKENGETDEFGMKVDKFYCGGYLVQPILHDLFNQGSFANSALLFDSKDVVYRFKAGLDMSVKDNIQSPSFAGVQREFRGVIGIQVMSGGANVVKLTNWA